MKNAVCAALVGLGVLVAGAEQTYEWSTSGSYAVGKTASIVIPEEGEVYLKLSGVTAGNAYTFVATGSGASVETIYTYVEEGDVFDIWFGDSSPDLKTANRSRCIIYESTWMDEYIVKDPNYVYAVEEDYDEWKESKRTPNNYYLYVSGDAGTTISLTSVKGVEEEPIPDGEPSRPKVIVPTTVPQTFAADFIVDQGSYYFASSLTAGSTYYFATEEGTAETPVTLEFNEAGLDSCSIRDVSAEMATPVGNVAYLMTVAKDVDLSYAAKGTGKSFALTTQCTTNGTLGKLTVTTKGAQGTWSLKGSSDWYETGKTVTILGEQTVVFGKIEGLSTPPDQVVVPTELFGAVSAVGTYSDIYDPADDTAAGAVKIVPAVTAAQEKRSLFGSDVDYFTFSAKDGVCYNFALRDVSGQPQIAIFRKDDASETPLKGPAEKIAAFAPGKGDYIVRVAKTTTDDASYALEYSCANVGTISFAKTAVSAKKTAGVVTLSVNRSSAEGQVRVRYGTVYGTAKPGVDYVAQNGELVWANGDKKAKTITIKLLPELFATAALSRQFQVALKAYAADELAENEYPAAFAAGKDVAVVTVTEPAGKAAKEIKAATTKPETVPIEIGTYQGVLTEADEALTNGFPALASVTFTAKNAAKKALSAKVTVAGKSYAFAADAWDADLSTETSDVASLTQLQKVGKLVYTNTLTVCVQRGQIEDWQTAAATVELKMNVPDTKGSGVQQGIVYRGELFRDNSKVPDYLTAVVSAVGYYTVALVPDGVSAADGIPAGNGYLTLTIDNKGKAKVAGLLADGSTKPSYSSIIAIRDDGETVLVPIFVAKSPYCFGGTLKLVRGDDGVYVVDSSQSLVWNNDNAALTRDGKEGWSLMLEPVGGYFNTVNNLQASYLTASFRVETTAVAEMPDGFWAAGYASVTNVQPEAQAVDVLGNTVSVAKRVLAKNGKVVDLGASVNACNVQVKLARATGLVSGSFALWTQKTADGSLKEMTGFKHNGILLLARDENASLNPEVMSAGFFTQKVKVETKRTYVASLPFNLLAIDQGEPDWYADDWGE